MKRYLLTIILAANLYAAPWDGLRGNLTILTTSGDLASVAGLFNFPVPQDRYITMFSVLCNNPQVNNVRVSVRYRDQFGNLQRMTREADAANDNIGWITVTFPILVSQIEGEPWIEARVISTVATVGQP